MQVSVTNKHLLCRDGLAGRKIFSASRIFFTTLFLSAATTANAGIFGPDTGVGVYLGVTADGGLFPTPVSDSLGTGLINDTTINETLIATGYVDQTAFAGPGCIGTLQSTATGNASVASGTVTASGTAPQALTFANGCITPFDGNSYAEASLTETFNVIGPDSGSLGTDVLYATVSMRVTGEMTNGFSYNSNAARLSIGTPVTFTSVSLAQIYGTTTFDEILSIATPIYFGGGDLLDLSVFMTVAGGTQTTGTGGAGSFSFSASIVDILMPIGFDVVSMSGLFGTEASPVPAPPAIAFLLIGLALIVWRTKGNSV